MRNKKRNTNIKILQSQLQHLVVDNDENPINENDEKPISATGIKELPIINKIKKKGIQKDELISTKRLLTM